MITLSEKERKSVEDYLEATGSETSDPEQATQLALEAYSVGKLNEPGKELLQLAGYKLIGGGLWSKIPSMLNGHQSKSMTVEQATSIVTIAWEAGLYPAAPPTEPDELIAEAKEVVSFVEKSDQDTEVMNQILELSKGSFQESEIEDYPTVPFDGYDGMRITEFKIRIEEGKLDDFLDQIVAYENTLNKPRIRILGYVEKRKEQLEKGDEPQESEEKPTGTSEDQGQEEDTAPPTPDTGGSDVEAEGESDSSEAGSEDRRIAQVEYDELVTDATQEIEKKFLHKPPEIEYDSEEVNIPFDVTQISDAKLQKLYGTYNALAYRTNYLLALEEAKLRRVKMAVKDFRSYLFNEAVRYDHQNHQRTMADINSQIEQVPVMRDWLLKENILDCNVEAYRSQRDGYYREVDMLSRLATMRQQEAERSGNR